LAEQLYSGPGSPLIVYASETFGPPPVCMAWLITASVSTFHHSPETFFELKFVLLYIWIIKGKIHKTKLRVANNHIVESTEDDGNFLVGFGKWVRNATLGKNDKRTIDG
jgi:hypothetical protein